jgi:hypothetical protein
MDKELSELARQTLENAEGLVARSSALESKLRGELIPPTVHLIDAGKRWMALYNDLRGFGHILAWQYWFDFHGGGVLSHRYEGHDARVSLDLDYLASALDLKGMLRRSISIDGGTVDITGPTSLERVSSRKDMLRVATQGVMEFNGLSSIFTLEFDLLVLVEGGLARAHLGTGCRLRIDGAASDLRANLQEQVTNELSGRLPAINLMRELDLSRLGMVLHSAHVDHFLTFFLSESLPDRPVYRVAANVDTPPAPEGWEDMILSVSDDYVQRVVGRQMNRTLGWLHYKPDPLESGQFVLPIVYRVDVDMGGTIDLGWFGSYSWRHRSTHWPELWIRMRGLLRNDGIAEINSYVALAGSDQNDSERNVVTLTNVERLKSETIPEKSFTFRIALGGQR